jgi:glutamate dehydrogenase
MEARLEQLFEHWSAQDRSDGGLFVDFARAFLARSGVRIFQTHDADSLRRAVESGFELASQRTAGERRVRSTEPADLPGRAVIEILQEDRPFLVDTLRLLLRRHRLREQCLLHPTLSVERNSEGVLERVIASDSRSDKETNRESFIYIEVFPRLDARAARAFEDDLATVMDWVRNVTNDHSHMIRAVRDMESNVEFAGHTLDVAAGRSDKICRFLDWLVEDHFVLLGVRQYDVSRQDDDWEVRIRASRGLGIWRGEYASRFAEPVRGDDLPPGLRAALDDPRIIQISKGFVESRIHRAGRMDRILVKEHDDQGRISGFQIISGLFTFAALQTPCSRLPLLSERLEQILADDGTPAGSHRHKAIVAAFDSAPMEFLLGASVTDNAALILEIVEAEGAEALRVVLRSDSRGRSFYVAVIMPRERYGEVLRSAIRRLFERDGSVGFVDDRVSFLEEGNALLHFFCTMKTGEAPDVMRLEREIRRLAANWDDRLTDELIQDRGPAEGGELAARYVDAFPEGLHVTTHPADAVRDIEGLEALFTSGEPQVALCLDRSRPNASDQLLRIYLREEKLLSDLLPIIDRLGIRVVDARQIRVSALDRPLAYLHALRIEPLGESQPDLDALEGRLADALRAVFAEVMPSDSLNGLILSAGLDWREVELMRSYVEYYNQIQSGLTRRFVSDVLLQNPTAVRLLVRYHAARLGDAPADGLRSEREESLGVEFAGYRDRIDNLNEDRALGALFELVDATLRTNFYAEADRPHRVAAKLDPSLLSDLRQPHAYREIFVHAPGMNGIHIRGGPVARGGLRWSDRLDDFRTEVLGLMRTQQLKNGLIVPVGAKGGFVLRTMGLSGREARAEADAKYAEFIESLLDVTDNIAPDGSVVHPEGVHCRDGDDPYLVVAADKGTAHLSDTANSIAIARDFWLGDAFASGGSVGYDHKKYAITARGAWECVRHHFAELGIDPEAAPYSVVGIGDMSGDVFGNGLLLMKQARLVAAFDHRHIFLDPDPEPERAWAERKRLFDLPGSSWSDYSIECLSSGGGVHPRSAKKVQISPEVRACLGIQDATLTGPDLVCAILAAPVDLLWNGGIGTYIKASHETHASVGDRANESVRIDASALRARVVGEGGNLGLTQEARVEAALAGVRLDTDAIHNSAGVDLSDHEVNYKILLAPVVREGSLGESERAACLFDVADDACESVLRHNRSQSLAISLDERRSRLDPEAFRVASEVLCKAQGVSAAELGLPDDASLQYRKRQGEGLVRPELSVLLGLAKLDVRLALATHAFVDEEEMIPLHAAYYPHALREKFRAAFEQHRLRREIVALEATNQIIDVGGVTAITNLMAKRGISIAAAAAAWQTADSILDAASLRDALLALRQEIRLESVYDALIDLDTAVQDVARLLIAENLGLPGTKRTTAWREGIYGLSAHLDGFLSAEEMARYRERQAQLAVNGFPGPLSAILAAAPLADRGFNIVRLVEGTDRSAADLAPAYAKLGERSRINWVYQNLPLAQAEDVWDRIVLMDLRTEVLSLQRDLTRHAVSRRPQEPLLAVDDFLLDHASVVARVRALINESTSTPTTSWLSVVTQTLMRLRSDAG